MILQLTLRASPSKIFISTFDGWERSAFQRLYDRVGKVLVFGSRLTCGILAISPSFFKADLERHRRVRFCSGYSALLRIDEEFAA